MQSVEARVGCFINAPSWHHGGAGHGFGLVGAPTVRDFIAQGANPGYCQQPADAVCRTATFSVWHDDPPICQGYSRIAVLQTAGLSTFHSQGVALGCVMLALQAIKACFRQGSSIASHPEHASASRPYPESPNRRWTKGRDTRPDELRGRGSRTLRVPARPVIAQISIRSSAKHKEVHPGQPCRRCAAFPRTHTTLLLNIIE